MKVLFLTPSLPAPPRRGFQTRAWHQLRGLGPRHQVTLLAYAGGPVSEPHLAGLRAACEAVVTVPFRPARAVLSGARALVTGGPVQVAIHGQPAFRRAVGDLLARGGFDLLHVQLARLAEVPGQRPVPGVLDLVDALSLNMVRRAARDRGPARLAAALEARRLAAFERAACRSWERLTVTTAEDRQSIGEFPNLVVNPNGVDLEQLPFSAGARRPGSIVFTGNLGYFPNQEAVRWFVAEVLPLVRRELPSATFTAVGARPGAGLRALATGDGRVRILADVPDVGPWLAEAAVAVAPLAAGSGHPLKVLDAMARGAPVVASPLGAVGLAAEPGRHLLAADGAVAFAQAVLRLLRDPGLAARIAAEARRLVEERYGWERSVAQMGEIWEAAAAERRR